MAKHGRKLQEKLRAHAQTKLEPGEELQSVMVARTFGNMPPQIAGVLLLIFSYRVIVVTDQRILLCRGGRFFLSPVKRVLKEVPRQTQLGPWHGVYFSKTEAFGDKLYIFSGYQSAVTAADAAIGAATAE